MGISLENSKFTETVYNKDKELFIKMMMMYLCVVY